MVVGGVVATFEFFLYNDRCSLLEGVAVRHVTRLGTHIYSFCSTTDTFKELQGAVFQHGPEDKSAILGKTLTSYVYLGMEQLRYQKKKA